MLADEANFQPKCVRAIEVIIRLSQSVDSKRCTAFAARPGRVDST